ncbi:MAG TPA: hypothetical protein VF650_09480 [Allosphingosinicella sp.]|jgi:hypothetical protein
MRRIETWLTALLCIAITLLLPMAALEPVSIAAAKAPAASAAAACDDGSAHLVMGCASVLL